MHFRLVVLRAARVVALLLLPALAAAQGERKVLTQDTYDLWRSILQPTLSPDGRWAVYTLSPTAGNGELVVRATAAATEYRVARGSTGRPLQSVTGQPFSPQAAQVTGDSRFVVFLRYPTQGALDSARARRARAADQPKASLGILSLADGNVTEIEKVRGYSVARDGGRWVVYQPEADTAASRNGARAGADSSARPARRKDTGSPLVIRELATGTETRIEHVSAYELNESERWLAYARAGADSLGVDGVYVRDLTTGVETALKVATGNYRSLAFDEAGSQLAFITDADSWGAETVRFAVYHAALAGPRSRPGPQQATRAVAASEIAEGLQVAERSRVDFVESGSALTFGVSRIQPDSIPADSLADKAVVDLWHWQDARPQPMQRIQAGQDRNRQYTAIYHIAAKQMRQLGSREFPNITLSSDGRTAVANTNVPYELDAIAGEGGTDINVINTLTGAVRRVATKVRGGGQLSPGGKYVTWWENRAWRVHDIAANRTRELTAGVTGVSFEDESHDTPSEPGPYGLGGWAAADAAVLVYDRFDVWDVDPAGVRAARNLTDGAGRRDSMTFRVVDFDADLDYIDPAAPLYLRAFDIRSKDAGVYRDRLGANTAPERLVMAPKTWPVLQKARRAEQFLVARADFREYPDLWSGPRFDQLTRLSDAMPEQSQYRWGNVRLHKWMNSDGVPMEGLLYTPEGFDPSRKYAMVVYFYEQLSDNLHQYHRPAGRNIINPSVYTSLGYVVFFPNIHYTPGYPGPSSVKSIVPGVQSLIAQGFVDPKRVGIGGQSWGGYQTAYIITQTNLFAAAVPNATVVNMTSAYGGIRWESGVERAIVNYERGQSRIGGSLWEYPERYMENSPLFFLDRVTTPVLFMANDADGAVPWYQGIEFFVAMRRLGKEAYMLNYNGDAHNPRKYANQKDIDRRMQEFFAHHLLGAPKPEWMERGIPFLERGRDQLNR
ncbi:prolyl oligopeptidase family serine peptidase [Pseudogemmatithrix spongiicola]|uniref:Prolyl oligopeptidase family serine peptidase n=1 Tax=Pseudogemmatithrix spongiicola TaxID=3062599 RepID=A0AA49JVH7_9BACT|nr:prolyl oligopeptidase family serine peptidase [Gemmatimonadaceae bacterium 'strain 138']WKW15509.1 prolyl oligopeptidase family serine peptidase [Gemmatimonadaceae bacterium 'strain 318']